MMPPHCSETSLDKDSFPRSCVLVAGHTDNHMGWDGTTWEPPEQVLPQLQHRWGRTHRIVWTGALWVATHRDPHTHWRTEVEPTPEQLEAALCAHHGDPTGPPGGTAPDAVGTS